MKWFLVGATGFVGGYLVDALLKKKEHQVYLVSRKKALNLQSGELTLVSFDDDAAWVNALEDSDIIVNLAGAPIAEKKWSHERKKELYESRIGSIKKLEMVLEKVRKKPSFYINSSAVGYYGNEAIGVDEASSAKEDFLAKICVDWEFEAKKLSEKHGIPLGIIRFAVVLGRGKGYVGTVSKPFYFYLGGHFGSGENYFSWIHVVDLVSVIIACAEEKKEGIYNAVSVNPVLSRDFSRILGKVLNRPSWFHVPYFVLRIIFGREMAEFLVANQKIVSKNLSKLNFQWKYPNLLEALKNSV